eukprot:ANDGO_01477.mRNA.1 UPF0696 protein C11orf68 homolog OS=Danio rerio GN=P5436 PE=2 SV=1
MAMVSRESYEENVQTIQEREKKRAWMRYDPTSDGPLHNWLSRNRPTQVCADEVAWICISNPFRQQEENEEASDLGAMIDMWNDYAAHLWRPAEMVAYADDLAREFNVLSGKWMVFCDPTTVDGAWESICVGVFQGSLGSAAKVSPIGNQSRSVICVYTSDYMDRAGVFRLRDILRRLGFTAGLGFKPDVYTHLGIYRGNPWNIRPVRYWD